MNRPRPNARPRPPPVHFIDPQLVARVMALKESIWLRIGTMQTDMGDHDRSLHAFERVLRVNSANLHALTQAGAVLAKKERYAIAIGHLQRAISINASCGEAWAVLGHCHVMKDDLPNAYEAYQNALNNLRDPSDPNLWYGIGLLYDRYGSLDNALEAFLAVLRIAPHFERYIEVCFCIGVIYKEQRKLDQALHYFNLVRASPSTPIPPLTRADTWYQIGHVNELKKDIAEALKIYKLALNENPRHSKTLQNLGWLEHTKLDNSRQAIARLQKSLDADQNDAQTWYLLGRVHMGLEEFKEAYDSYQQAVYRDGRNSTYWCSIGVLYSQMNQFRDAMDAYARAIRLNPSVSEVWFDLGTLYERTGQSEDAITAYQRAVELAPEKNRSNIMERIQLLQSNRSGAAHANTINQPRQVHSLSLPMSTSNLQRHQQQTHLPSMRTQNAQPSLPRNRMQLPPPSAPRSRPQASASTSIGFNAPPPSNHLRSSMPLLNSLPLSSHSMQPAHHRRTELRKDPRQSHLSSTGTRPNILSQPLPKLPPRQPINHINGVAADGKQKHANPMSSLPLSAPMPRREHGNSQHAPRLPSFRMHSLAPLGQNASKRSLPGSSSMMTSGAMNININSSLINGKKLPQIGSSSGMRDSRMNNIAIIAGKDAPRTGNDTHSRDEQRPNGRLEANLQHSSKKTNAELPVSSAPTVSSSSGSVNLNPPIPSMPLPSLRSAPMPQQKENKNNGKTSSIAPRFGLSSLSHLARSTAPKMPVALPSPLAPAPKNNLGNCNGNTSNMNTPIPMSDKHIPAVPKARSPTAEKASNGLGINIPRSVPISSLAGDRSCGSTGRDPKLTPSKRAGGNDAVQEEDKITKRPRVYEKNERNEQGKENISTDANEGNKNSNNNSNEKDANGTKKEEDVVASKNGFEKRATLTREINEKT